MAQSPLNSGRRDEPAEFNLREWALKARMISRENTKSRRFSSSYITSFREDSKSIRSNINISSTAASPGCNLREEIDPSTYSFSSALRALQARSVNNNTWEGLLSPEGFALNSKWNEAEKYICNPVSGEVPMECLSAKTLGGRSFRNLTSRITMSAPLIYPSHSRFIQTTPTYKYNDEAQFQNIIKGEKKVANMLTRDVGVGSKLPDLSPAPAAASSPKLGENSPMSNAAAEAGAPPKLKSEEDKGEMKETDDGNEETEREEEETRKTEAGEKQVHHRNNNNNNNMWKCRGGKIGCLSLRSLWMTRKSDKHKSRNKKKKKKKKNIFPLPCYNNNNINSRC